MINNAIGKETVKQEYIVRTLKMIPKWQTEP